MKWLKKKKTTTTINMYEPCMDFFPNKRYYWWVYKFEYSQMIGRLQNRGSRDEKKNVSMKPKVP